MEIIFWIIVICIVLSAFGSSSSSSKSSSSYRRSSSNSSPKNSTSSSITSTLKTSNVQLEKYLSELTERQEKLERFKEIITTPTNSPFSHTKFFQNLNNIDELYIQILAERLKISLGDSESKYLNSVEINNKFENINNSYCEFLSISSQKYNNPNEYGSKSIQRGSASGLRKLFNVPILDNKEILTAEQLKIKEEVDKRGIKFLTHFTQLSNLNSIIENGLLGRKSLECRSINYNYNDEHRIDNIQDGICCSISFPNYKMFWGIKKNKEKQLDLDPDSEWVILRLKPDLLWLKKAYFCQNNAASNQERFNQNKTSVNAFKAMFSNLEYVDRKELDIPDCFTTNPQAEVVFIEKIEPEWIIDICKKNGYGMDCYKVRALNSAKYETETLFKPRPDYQFWTKH